MDYYYCSFVLAAVVAVHRIEVHVAVTKFAAFPIYFLENSCTCLILTIGP